MPRQYTSPLRVAQARRTRLDIIETALRLFLENGYSQTSIRQIAREAGIAERTVYVAFTDKPTLLKAIADYAFFGGTQEGEGEADFVRDLTAISDPGERLRFVIHQTAVGWEQGLAAVGRMVTAAATGDKRLEGFVAEMVDRRHRDTWSYTEAVLGRPLPHDARHEQMVDELEAITSEEVYWILSMERQWTRENYEKFVFDSVIATMNRHGEELTDETDTTTP